MFYLIIGTNIPLIDDAWHHIQHQHPDIPFESPPPELNHLLNATQCMDLFSSKKGLAVHHPAWAKKPTPDTLKMIELVIETAQSAGMPLVWTLPAIDKRTGFYKMCQRHGASLFYCDPFKEWETDKAIEWIQSYGKRSGLTIQLEAMHHFIDCFGPNIGLIKQEINACATAIFPKTILSKQDALQSSGTAIGHYIALNQAIKEGNKAMIIHNIHTLLAQKEDPHKLFNHLVFQCTQWASLSIGLASNMDHTTLATQLGKHPFFIKKQLEALRKNPLRQTFLSIVCTLAAIDRTLKQSTLSSHQGMMALCAQLTY